MRLHEERNRAQVGFVLLLYIVLFIFITTHYSIWHKEPTQM